MLAWIQADNLTIFEVFYQITDTGVGSDVFGLHYLGATGGDPISCFADGVGTGSTQGGGFGASWQPNICLFTSTTSREAFDTCTSAGTNTTDTVAYGSFEELNIGRGNGNSTNTNYADGFVSHFAVWEATLSLAERGELCGGIPPIFIQPNACVGYWPLMESNATDNAEDHSGSGFTLTQNGDPPASRNMPPIFWPAGGQ